MWRRADEIPPHYVRYTLVDNMSHVILVKSGFCWVNEQNHFWAVVRTKTSSKNLEFWFNRASCLSLLLSSGKKELLGLGSCEQLRNDQSGITDENEIATWRRSMLRFGCTVPVPGGRPMWMIDLMVMDQFVVIHKCFCAERALVELVHRLRVHIFPLMFLCNKNS